MTPSHTLVVYTIAGVPLAYLLTWGAKVVLKIQRPQGQIQLLFLTLTIPYLAYFFHRFLGPLLFWEGVPFHELSRPYFPWLCSLGNWGAAFHLPVILFLVLSAYRLGRYYYALKNIQEEILAQNSPDHRRVEKILTALADKAGLKTPRLKVLKREDYCCFTFGLRQPCVALSQRLVEELTDEELEGIIAHELAHVAHGDVLQGWLALILRDFSFYFPLTHGVVGQLRDNQELRADDWAVKLTGRPWEYGAVLLKVWRLHQGQALGFTFLGAISQGRVSRRVERILQGEFEASQGAPLWLLSAIAALVTTALAYLCCSL